MDDHTKESADALLPEIRRRLTEMQNAYEQASESSANVAPKVGANGADSHPGQWMKATRRLEEHSRWFADNSIILRDVMNGIIDFPSSRNGEEILLCWKLGEDEVGFWHYPDSGFASREPL